MEKIRILGILTHYKLKRDKVTGKEVCYSSGVDYLRVISPLEHLPKDKFEVDIKYDFMDGYADAYDMLRNYDIIYSSYIDTVETYVKVKSAANMMKRPWIMDIDDNLWQVSKSHPYIKDYLPESPKFQDQQAILKDTSQFTVTNSFLRYKTVEYLNKNINQIEVLPNFIDLKQYDHKKFTKKDHEGIQIGYMGGSSHFDDINKPEFINAMKIIMDKYPQVSLKTTFYMPQLKAKFGSRYKYTLGSFNIYRFIDKIWTDMCATSDIFVAPLSYTPYSRAKSYCKYLEYSAGKVPSVMEKIDPYEQVLNYAPERGLLASRTEEWVEHLSYLIENPKARERMGKSAYDYVKKNHTIQGNIKIYTDYFTKIFDNR